MSGPDTEGYAAAYRDGRWVIIDRFGTPVELALSWADYKLACKQADKMNDAVIRGRFTA